MPKDLGEGTAGCTRRVAASVSRHGRNCASGQRSWHTQPRFDCQARGLKSSCSRKIQPFSTPRRPSASQLQVPVVS